jgi:hypothetical protein
MYLSALSSVLSALSSVLSALSSVLSSALSSVLSSEQQTVLTLQQRSQTLVSRAASAADSSKVLQARVAALEREREALRGLVDGERKRAGDMAQLIAVSE